MRQPTSGSHAEARAAALFVLYLDELPLHRWLEAARMNHASPGYAETDAILRAALQSFVSPAAVFETRNGVLAALQRFDSAEGRWLTRGRRSTQYLRPETERAALAVLARRHLEGDQFAALYAGFEPLIPAALLFGID
jgi:hypothetical protein